MHGKLWTERAIDTLMLFQPVIIPEQNQGNVAVNKSPHLYKTYPHLYIHININRFILILNNALPDLLSLAVVLG